MSSAWKQTASFWEEQCVLLDTEPHIFFPLPFQRNPLTCIQVSELGLIQVEFPMGFFLIF